MSIPASLDSQPIYEPDQLPVLTRLLAEYTAKLNKQTVDIFATKRDRDGEAVKTGFWLIGYVVLESLVVSSLVNAAKSAAFVSLFSIFVFVMGVSLASSSVTLYKTLSDLNNIRRLELLKTVAQLERLVRRTSPIAEYTKLSLGEKLELDIRLADADAALEYAAQYVGQRSHDANGLVHAGYK